MRKNAGKEGYRNGGMQEKREERKDGRNSKKERRDEGN